MVISVAHAPVEDGSQGGGVQHSRDQAGAGARQGAGRAEGQQRGGDPEQEGQPGHAPLHVPPPRLRLLGGGGGQQAGQQQVVVGGPGDAGALGSVQVGVPSGHGQALGQDPLHPPREVEAVGVRDGPARALGTRGTVVQDPARRGRGGRHEQQGQSEQEASAHGRGALEEGRAMGRGS